MIEVLLWAGTIVGVLLLIMAGGVAMYLMVVVCDAIVERDRCAVCRNGGHPGDYPPPALDAYKRQEGDYRLCQKHLGMQRKMGHMEKRSGL
jgi:hypothetical protein